MILTQRNIWLRNNATLIEYINMILLFKKLLCCSYSKASFWSTNRNIWTSRSHATWPALLISRCNMSQAIVAGKGAIFLTIDQNVSAGIIGSTGRCTSELILVGATSSAACVNKMTTLNLKTTTISQSIASGSFLPLMLSLKFFRNPIKHFIWKKSSL